MRKSIVYLALGIAAVVGVTVALGNARPEPALDVERIVAGYEKGKPYDGLTITYPQDETLFPPEIIPPTFRWQDSHDESDAWVVTIEFEDRGDPVRSLCFEREWTPSDEQWERFKRRSLEHWAKVTVLGVNRQAPEAILSAAAISIRTSEDEVGAPLFFREVNLPFLQAVKDPAEHIRWRFGPISSKGPPPIVLEKLPVCGNCHSFSADGKTLAMEVDSGNDKGSYAIAPVEEEIVLDPSKIITWSDYRREDNEVTFGLLCQASPDGRYVVGTVKDRALAVYRDELAFSQLFFLVKGILAIYDRQKETFYALPGADDRRHVQTNGTWSPDGKYIVFARSRDEAYDPVELRNVRSVLVPQESAKEFLSGGRKFVYDLYRIPFNGGKGGKAEPVEGASNNGMSNYFPKYSPDGKWIVFCKAKSFMLLQPDSELYIIPAEGGRARRLRCNTPRMNSWHSWSPNGKWLVFSSKANSLYTQLFLTHIDDEGRSSPPVVLSQFTDPRRAANIPEFVNAKAGAIRKIHERFLDDVSFARAGMEFLKQNDYQGAERSFRKALELNPDNGAAHEGLGVTLLGQGELEEAAVHLVKAIEAEPDSRNAHCNLGNILMRQGKPQEAMNHYRQALRIDPEFDVAHHFLGLLLLTSNQLEEAKKHLAEAVRLKKDNFDATYLLGVALLREGKPQQAAAQFRRALELNSNFVPALRSLALIRSTSRDPAVRNGREAVTLAAKACELTRYKDAEALDMLGTAYAEAGRFTEAVSAAQQALRISQAAGNVSLADAIRQRIQLYQQRKPFRREG